MYPTTPPPIHDAPELPRERLLRTGTVTLGDKELLALLIGTGVRDRPAVEVAADLMRRAGGISLLARASPRELSLINGIGSAGAARIAAAFELGRRVADLAHHRHTLGSPEDIYRLLQPRFAGLTQELFLAIGVDLRNGLLDITEIARGSLASVEVHPREVFRPLIRMAAAGAVIVHNHPTGDPAPSREDIELTRRLRQVGRVIGIPIVDHIIIGDRQYCSICEWLGASLDRD
ncbi:MAG TPA: DNA repair protein RadC [Kofleriaceae bacterium]|nr:DNA repair protein RadC [Kofleriaceae bacterium]